ncbi:hypothetical protein BX266_4371 [Streptomyces sp. TLI_171]|nr:hypothetical protein BX266_4371 [Streptomyces sp. TLI_171]
MLSALLTGLSTTATMELEDPLFVGLRDNTSGLAVMFLAPGLLLGIAGIAVGLYGSRRGRIAVAVAGLLLLAFGTYRATVLAPMLACDGGRIARQVDGSYRCYA